MRKKHLLSIAEVRGVRRIRTRRKRAMDAALVEKPPAVPLYLNIQMKDRKGDRTKTGIRVRGIFVPVAKVTHGCTNQNPLNGPVVENAY